MTCACRAAKRPATPLVVPHFDVTVTQPIDDWSPLLVYITNYVTDCVVITRTGSATDWICAIL